MTENFLRPQHFIKKWSSISSVATSSAQGPSITKVNGKLLYCNGPSVLQRAMFGQDLSAICSLWEPHWMHWHSLIVRQVVPGFKMLEILPPDLSSRIINQLNTREKLKAQLVCKSWAKVSKFDWRLFCLTRQETKSCEALGVLRRLAFSAETAQRLREINLSICRDYPIDLSKLWTAPACINTHNAIVIILQFWIFLCVLWCFADKQYTTKHLRLVWLAARMNYNLCGKGCLTLFNKPGAACSELCLLANESVHPKDKLIMHYMSSRHALSKFQTYMTFLLIWDRDVDTIHKAEVAEVATGMPRRSWLLCRIFAWKWAWRFQQSRKACFVDSRGLRHCCEAQCDGDSGWNVAIETPGMTFVHDVHLKLEILKPVYSIDQNYQVRCSESAESAMTLFL